MWNQFYIPEADKQNAELRQYCKRENVLPFGLKCAVIRRDTIRIRLEKLAFRMLQHINNSLNFVIERLIADLEHKGRTQGYYS